MLNHSTMNQRDLPLSETPSILAHILATLALTLTCNVYMLVKSASPTIYGKSCEAYDAVK